MKVAVTAEQGVPTARVAPAPAAVVSRQERPLPGVGAIAAVGLSLDTMQKRTFGSARGARPGGEDRVSRLRGALPVESSPAAAQIISSAGGRLTRPPSDRRVPLKDSLRNARSNRRPLLPIDLRGGLHAPARLEFR